MIYVPRLRDCILAFRVAEFFLKRRASAQSNNTIKPTKHDAIGVYPSVGMGGSCGPSSKTVRLVLVYDQA